MTFLKKLGLALLKGAVFASGLEPVLAPLLGPILGAKYTEYSRSASNDLTLIGSKVLEIETALSGKTGADKFMAAKSLVGGIIRTSELVAGHEIADEVTFQKGVDEITQGVVDLLNSIKSDHVPSVPGN